MSLWIALRFSGDLRDARRISEALYRLTPDVAIVTPCCVAGEFSRVLSLYRKESLSARLRVLLERLGVSAKMRSGTTLLEAYVLTFYPEIKRMEDAPIEALCLLMKEADPLLEAFRGLGLRRLGELLVFSRSELLRRFGAQGQLLQDRLRRVPEADLPWKRAVPEEKIIEFQSLDDERKCADLEPLLFELKTLLDRVFLRLRSRGERLRRLQIELTLDAHTAVQTPTRVIDAAFSFPQSSITGVLKPLREILNRAFTSTPLESLVEEVKVTVAETTPCESLQRQLFEDTDTLGTELSALLEQLEKKNGAPHLFQYKLHASYVPEHSFERTAPDLARLLKPETDVKPPIAVRPSRLLRTPQRMHRLGRYLFADQERWTVQTVSRPELIETEGWLEQAVSRSYYRVETREGDRLWIFRAPDGLYLHGWFE
jgi:protein ImuB